MFLFDLFATANLNGHYLIVADRVDFWVAMFCWMSLLASAPVLANLRQPTPNWQARR